MNAEPPTARFQMEHRPRRPGYARRYAAKAFSVMFHLYSNEKSNRLYFTLWWIQLVPWTLLVMTQFLSANERPFSESLWPSQVVWEIILFALIFTTTLAGTKLNWGPTIPCALIAPFFVPAGHAHGVPENITFWYLLHRMNPLFIGATIGFVWDLIGVDINAKTQKNCASATEVTTDSPA